jgi:hypothetical protein
MLRFPATAWGQAVSKARVVPRPPLFFRQLRQDRLV